jgi:hypothetical protein
VRGIGYPTTVCARVLASGGIPLARICIFNNLDALAADQGDDSASGGTYIQEWELFADAGGAGIEFYTSPIRLFTHQGAASNISYEFLMRSNGADWPMRWRQEFYGDHPHMGADTASARAGQADNYDPSMQFPPIGRDFPGAESGVPPNALQGGAGPGLPWAREQVAVVGATGNIDHFDATRRMTMVDKQPRWFPMEVYSYWTRLAIWWIAPNTPTTNLLLQIWAHVGGYAEERYLIEQSGAYNYSQVIT